MASRVAYHHPENDRLSIDYVAYSFEEAEDRIDGFDGDEIGVIEEYDLNETVYVVYKGREIPEVAEDIEVDIHGEVAEMSQPDQIITTRILQLFESIADEKYEQESERLSAYKEIEVDRIPEAMDRITWTESVPVSGGELVSCLILRHALPNANHRTSLAMLSLYYQAISESFEMPTTTTDDYDWSGWVDEYIERSKQLLTVRRNVPRFTYLSDAGCSVVERKDGIGIHLEEFDLSMGHWEAMDEYAERHKRESIEFAHEVLRKAGTSELRDGEPLSKQEFADRLQGMD